MLKDRISENPDTMIAMGLAWLVVAAWVVSVVGWLIQGDIDFLTALGGISIGMGLGAMATLAKDPAVAPMVVVALILTFCAFPIVRYVLNRQGLKSIDADAIERAYQLLVEKPGNAALRFKLARHVYAAGMPGHAMAIAEEAMKSMPKPSFGEEYSIYEGWKRARVEGDARKPMACVDCGHMNDPGLIHCEKCGAPFLLDNARGKIIGGPLARKIVAGWCAMVLAIVGIPYAARSLSPVMAIVAVVVLVLVAVVLLVFSFRTKEPQAAK